MKDVKKIGILATHPIQYHAPLFRALAGRDSLDQTVYFCHNPTAKEQGSGFGVAFEWDVDLTSGFKHFFLVNKSRRPTVGFFGYDCPEIDKIIDREKFDLFIVHGWAWKSSWQAIIACWKTGTRLGVRSDSQLHISNRFTLLQKIKHTLKSILYPIFISRFDVCLPYGKRSAQYFEYFGGRNVVIARHFVDNEFFHAQKTYLIGKRQELRGHWGIPESALCFMFCGKFEQIKKPMDILRALHQLVLNESCSVHLLMVGDGALKEECIYFSKENKLPVTFTGFINQKEIPKAYAVADCLILASRSETWGLVCNEAMASGLPVIISEGCGCAHDLVVDGKTGWIIKDDSKLYDCMKMCIANPDLVKSYGQNAYEQVQAFCATSAADSIVGCV